MKTTYSSFLNGRKRSFVQFSQDHKMRVKQILLITFFRVSTDYHL